MSLAEMAVKYARSEQCWYNLFLPLKLVQIILILMNIMINLINQSNTSQLKINDSYLMTYTHVGTKYVPQTNWRSSCQLHDIYCNSNQINWLKHKMCNQFNDSSLPVINDIYVNCYMKLSACFGAACFHAACFRACKQAAFGAGSNAALTDKTRLTNLLYLLTQNEIINDLNNIEINCIDSLKIGYINSRNNPNTKLLCQRIVRIKWLENKKCRHIYDSYRPLKNTDKKARQCKYGQINWLKNKMCRQTYDSYHPVRIDSHIEYDSYYTVKNAHKLCSIACAHTNRQAVRTNPFTISINFEPSTKRRKSLQCLVDWRTKQKPSRRAGLVITAIKDSPGLIRGRLEPQRGRSLTVKAVCGGTLGWKDPPFNSIVALPGATHQDQTQNDLNDLINPTISNSKINYILPRIISNGMVNYYLARITITYLLATQYVVTGQVASQGKLHCQFFWHKNNMCRQTHDISNYPVNLGQWQHGRMISLQIEICHENHDSYLSPKIIFNELHRQHSSQKKLPRKKLNLGKKDSCPSTGKDIDARALVWRNVKLQVRQDRHNILLALSLILRQGKTAYVIDPDNPTILAYQLQTAFLPHRQAAQVEVHCQNIYWHKNRLCRQDTRKRKLRCQI